MSLWNAVNVSKDNVINSLPNVMTFGRVPVSEHERSGFFMLKGMSPSSIMHYDLLLVFSIILLL